MAGEREKTAGQAAKEKVERRKALKQTEEAATGAARPGEEADQRNARESEKDLTAGTVEPGGLKPAGKDKASSPEELRAEVEQAREQLAASVEELTDRVDPRPKIEDAKRTASANAVPLGGALALLLVLIIWRRRRR